MKNTKKSSWVLSGGLLFAAVFAAMLLTHGTPKVKAAAQKATLIPQFEIDPWWPKPMPHDYVLGEVGGVTTDAKDNVWITTRVRTLAADLIGEDTGTDSCCKAAPPVIEFSSAGDFLQGWGGPGQGYQFPANPHGITIDYKGNVWIGGNAAAPPPGAAPRAGGGGGGAPAEGAAPAGAPQDHDTQIVKFTNDGKFLLQIGKANTSMGSLDTANFDRPTQVFVWPKTNEAFVSDGYGNRRVIVFDADTGAYKRMWGGYGHTPDDSVKQTRSADGNDPQQFNLPHGIVISDDGTVYVADRANNRIQSFDINGKYINEVWIDRETKDNRGTAFTVALSQRPEQRYIYDVNGSSDRIEIIDRKSMQVVGWFGRGGNFIGEWHWLHGIATDSKGNIYAEESRGNRVQKYLYKGMGTNQGVDAYWPKKPVS